MAELQRLGSEGNGLHTTRADLVNGRCLGALRAASRQSDLTCWALAKTSRDDIAEVDLLDELRVQLDVVQSLLSGDGTQLDAAQRLETALEGANGRPCSGDDDDFIWGVERLDDASGEKVGGCGQSTLQDPSKTSSATRNPLTMIDLVNWVERRGRMEEEDRLINRCIVSDGRFLYLCKVRALRAFGSGCLIRLC